MLLQHIVQKIDEYLMNEGEINFTLANTEAAYIKL